MWPLLLATLERCLWFTCLVLPNSSEQTHRVENEVFHWKHFRNERWWTPYCIKRKCSLEHFFFFFHRTRGFLLHVLLIGADPLFSRFTSSVLPYSLKHTPLLRKWGFPLKAFEGWEILLWCNSDEKRINYTVFLLFPY